MLRGWVNGGYMLGFVTPDHRHGWFDKKTNEWGWHELAEVSHYTSCFEAWPDDSTGMHEQNRRAADDYWASHASRRRQPS